MSDRNTGAADPDGIRLTVLVVDDEAPARSELAYLLSTDPRIGDVLTAEFPRDALRQLQARKIDGVFLDIRMPGLSGLELAGIIGRFRDPPPVVFVTAYEEHAAEAFELGAVDYVLKPIRPQPLAEAVRRLVAAAATNAESSTLQAHPGSTHAPDEETILVERAGVTRFISLRDVLYVEAHGDYVRLHTDSATHLLRVPMATLEERWADAGFVRIHRSYLVSLAHITEVRLGAEQRSVMLGSVELAVSRRHTPALREMLARRARPRPGTR
jgi:DNA-binding LytR/AlgR family response regulator